MSAENVVGHEEMNFIEKTHHSLNIWHIPDHWDFGTFMGYPIQLNADTVIFTWVAMVLTLLLAWAAVAGANVRRPTKMQTVFEMLFDFMRGLINQSMDPKKGAGIFSIVVTFFLFTSVMNLMGVIPTFVKPTADFQTAFALALVTLASMYVWGIKYKGARYFKHYVSPNPAFLPINLMEDIAKPITMAFRLFGNMVAEEIMLLVILSLVTGTAWLAGGFLAGTAWLLMGIFISLIQAFIFAMLTIAFVGGVVGDDH